MSQKPRISLIEEAMYGGIPPGPVDLRRTWAESQQLCILLWPDAPPQYCSWRALHTATR